MSYTGEYPLQSQQKLTDQEFRTMLTLLHRYVMTEMDQWELWKFDTEFGGIYIDVSMISSGPDEMYIDVTHLIEQAQ